MSEAAKTARNAMRAKAKRLTSADPNEKVDSSSWSPAPLLEADKKTGARPLVKRLYKKGGKVVGKAEGKKAEFRADRKPRKSGGKAEHKAPWVDDLINRDVRMANDKREGVKHDGAFKKGGKAHKADGGSMLSPHGEKVKRLAEIKKLQLQSNPKTTDKNQWGDWHQERSRLESDLMDASRRLGPTRKDGGRAKKLGGGPIGMNPVGQQNQMMGKAAGMMKKGGKVHREHHADGDIVDRLQNWAGTNPKSVQKPYPNVPARGGNTEAQRVGAARQNASEMEDIAANTRLKQFIPFFGSDQRDVTNANFNAAGARQALDVANQQAGYKKGGKTDGHKVDWLHHAKGGKAKHSDEAQDKKLMHKLLKEKAFKASGGKAMHHKDCSCKMCSGGRMGKYSGGGVFNGNSKQKVPGVVPGGRMAKEGGGSTTPDFSGAYYDLFSGWHNLDKANPDQIAAMRPEDRAKAYEAQGNAPVRMGATPNTSTSTTYRRAAPKPSPMAAGPSNLSMMDPMQQRELAAQPAPAAPNQASSASSNWNTSESARMAQARRVMAQHPELDANAINTRLNPGNYYSPTQEPTGYGALDKKAADFGSWLYNQMRSADQPAGMYNKGGKVGKGKTNVNIIIASGKGQQPTGMMGGAPMPNAPVSPRIPQQAGQPPMGPQGMPPMTPQGMPMPPQGMPMGRKTGGRAYPIDTGSGGANARLEKIDAYGLKPTRGRK